jgi:hypothetical protein
MATTNAYQANIELSGGNTVPSSTRCRGRMGARRPLPADKLDHQWNVQKLFRNRRNQTKRREQHTRRREYLHEYDHQLFTKDPFLSQAALPIDNDDFITDDYDKDNNGDFLPEIVQFIPSSIPGHVYNNLLQQAWDDAYTKTTVVYWGEFDDDESEKCYRH